MYDLLAAYIENPVLEAFLQVRATVLMQPDFNPDADDLAVIEDLVAAGAWEEVAARIRAAIEPSYILSPGAHMQLGFALQQLGQTRAANVERAIASLLMRGIEITGDGSERAPFLVTRTSDEYDYLFARQLQFASCTEIERDGRQLDCILVREKGPIFFDVTDICALGHTRPGA